MTQVELLPCPFCGTAPEGTRAYGRLAAVCKTAHCPMHERYIYFNNWNARTPSSPTSPPQDGKRKCPRCPNYAFYCTCLGREIDAETIRTQSAELAALRAQAEGLRDTLRRIEPYGYHYAACGLITGLGFECSCGLNYARSEAKAALAPPQPVAKETKP